VEPIALRMLGEKGAKQMLQPLSRPPLPELQLERHSLAARLLYIKKGANSAWVKRQCCGRIGEAECCQVGVFLGCAPPEEPFGLAGHELCIPEDWL
jgi:hypothetical protein